MSRLTLIYNTTALYIYSPILDGEEMSEFHKFLSKKPGWTHPSLEKDFVLIGARIKKMAEECGARENLFRREGHKDDNVVALPVLQEWRSKKVGVLRLYCDRISDRILIIGNGDVKKVQSYQLDPILDSYVKTLQIIDKKIQSELTELDIDVDDVSRVLNIINTLTF